MTVVYSCIDYRNDEPEKTSSRKYDSVEEAESAINKEISTFLNKYPKSKLEISDKKFKILNDQNHVLKCYKLKESE